MSCVTFDIQKLLAHEATFYDYKPRMMRNDSNVNSRQMGDNVTLPYQDDSDRQSSTRSLRNAPEKCDDSAKMFEFYSRRLITSTAHTSGKALWRAFRCHDRIFCPSDAAAPRDEGFLEKRKRLLRNLQAAAADSLIKRARWAIKS
jgi:hypothetical protein